MISHHHKCVFIHIPKVAGQSIETVFLNLLNLTWETRGPLLLRENNDSKLGPPFLAHLKAEDYVFYNYMTEEQFNAYFKFAFVRNPWDRMVSIYKYLDFYSARMSFKKFVMKELPQNLWAKRYWFVRPQAEFIFNQDGKKLVDFIGKFENLNNDFRVACSKIGIQEIDLPHVNQSETFDNKASLLSKKMIKNILLPLTKKHTFMRYQDYYDSESADFVANLYEADIELFEYKASSLTSSKKE